jgi:hypothetical protein
VAYALIENVCINIDLVSNIVCDLCTSPGIVRVVKSGRLRCAEHVARTGESAWKVPPARPRDKWKSNIERDAREQMGGVGPGSCLCRGLSCVCIVWGIFDTYSALAVGFIPVLRWLVVIKNEVNLSLCLTKHHAIKICPIPRGGWEFFSSPPRPERLWDPPSLLYDGWRGVQLKHRDNFTFTCTCVQLSTTPWRRIGEWRYSFTPQPLYLRYPLNRRMGGPQGLPGHGCEEKNSQLLLGIEPRSSSL